MYYADAYESFFGPLPLYKAPRFFSPYPSKPTCKDFWLQATQNGQVYQMGMLSHTCSPLQTNNAILIQVDYNNGNAIEDKIEGGKEEGRTIYVARVKLSNGSVRE